MIDLFTKKLGVDYPWEKYAQVMVDDFVAGGMENSSATTNTATSLKSPELVPEFRNGVFWIGLAALRDPGLLEWSGGNIFKARVFPIFANSEKTSRG